MSRRAKEPVFSFQPSTPQHIRDKVIAAWVIKYASEHGITLGNAPLSGLSLSGSGVLSLLGLALSPSLAALGGSGSLSVVVSGTFGATASLSGAGSLEAAVAPSASVRLYRSAVV